MPKIIDPRSNAECDMSEVMRMQGFFVVGRGFVPFLWNDRGVSRYHATIFEYLDGFYIVDHSMNGTWLKAPGRPDLLQVYNTMTKSKVAISHLEAKYAQKAGSVGCVKLDRETLQKYESDLTAFLAALREASQRENFAAFGAKLQDGMELYFGRKNAGYIFRV
ncbi:MAG: FHA domain-containing protein [Candidatus Aenigmatarchaeota archaeon]